MKEKQKSTSVRNARAQIDASVGYEDLLPKFTCDRNGEFRCRTREVLSQTTSRGGTLINSPFALRSSSFRPSYTSE